jgi:hypothetical protein
MNRDANYYFFTNQRNLLQALTKGYLTRIDYWDRKTDDFPLEYSFTLSNYLTFSSKILNLQYTFLSDKTLIPIAIGLTENDLINLGFKKNQITESEIIFVGDEMIPIDLISKILFKSDQHINKLFQRYGVYLKLGGIDKCIVSSEIFENAMEIPSTPQLLNIKSDISKEFETKISKRIGSMGNYIIYLISNNNYRYLLYSSIVNSLLKTTYPIGAPFSICETVCDIFPEWNITDNELLLIASLFISNFDIDAQTKADCLSDFATQTTLTPSKNGHLTIFKFIDTLDLLLRDINEEIKTIDRTEILTKIESQFSKVCDPTIYDDLQILKIIKTILSVFDYTADPEKVEKEIDGLLSDILKYFMRGFYLFILEPINKDKLNIAITQNKTLPSEICKAIPMFLWGLARGAFAFDPEDKKTMLGILNKRALYNMALNYEDYEKGNFYLIPESQVTRYPGTKHAIGDYTIFLNEEGPFHHKTFEENKYIIQGGNDLTIRFSKKDEFEDVEKELFEIINYRVPISDNLLEYFLTDIFDQRLIYSIDLKEYSFSRMYKIKIQDEIEINFRGMIDVSIKFSKEDINNVILDLLSRRYGGVKFRNIPLNEKRKLRNYFEDIKIHDVELSSNPEEDKLVSNCPENFPNEKWTKIKIQKYLEDLGITYKKSCKKSELIALTKLR